MKIIILVAIFTIIYVFGMDITNKYLSSINLTQSGESIEVESMSAKIEGFVQNPGTYSINSNNRLIDLINLAGGLKENADNTSFNENLLISDGCSYYISSVWVDENDFNLKISLNNSDIALLDSLPGIGEIYAQRIVDYRKEHGNFTHLEQLMNIKGIGYTIFNNIKDLVCL